MLALKIYNLFKILISNDKLNWYIIIWIYKFAKVCYTIIFINIKQKKQVNSQTSIKMVRYINI